MPAHKRHRFGGGAQGVKNDSCGGACAALRQTQVWAREIADYLSAPDTFRAVQGPWQKVAGRTDSCSANGRGSNLCGSADLRVPCHTQEAQNWAHTIHAKVFGLNPRNPLEREGCEACHGPGSAHVQSPDAPLSIIRFTKKSQPRLESRTGSALPAIAVVNAFLAELRSRGPHDLGCSDCHNPMADFSGRGLQARASIN